MKQLKLPLEYAIKTIPLRRVKKTTIQAWVDEFDMPLPDHKYGYTASFLKSVLPQEEYTAFLPWMRGQTCTCTDTGEFVYYPCDVLGFLGQVRKGRKPLWD